MLLSSVHFLFLLQFQYLINQFVGFEIPRTFFRINTSHHRVLSEMRRFCIRVSSEIKHNETLARQLLASVGASAGRSIPWILPTIKSPPPLVRLYFRLKHLLAASPSFTACAIRTIDASFFLRIARTGSSSGSIYFRAVNYC